MDITANYRNILAAKIGERLSANPNLSLRAIAAKIGVSHTLIAQFIRGQKNLSRETVNKLARWLDLKDNELEQVLLLCEFETTKDPKYRDTLEEKLLATKPSDFVGTDLSLDVFKAISEWHHLAILELTRLQPKGLTEDYAKSKLGLSIITIRLAFETLSRLDLLSLRNGKWFRNVGALRVQSGKSNGAVRKFHAAMIQKALAALEEQKLEQRYVSGITVALDQKNLDKLNTLIEKFIAEVRHLSNKEKSLNSVYQINVQSFELTQREKDS